MTTKKDNDESSYVNMNHKVNIHSNLRNSEKINNQGIVIDMVIEKMFVDIKNIFLKTVKNNDSVIVMESTHESNSTDYTIYLDMNFIVITQTYNGHDLLIHIPMNDVDSGITVTQKDSKGHVSSKKIKKHQYFFVFNSLKAAMKLFSEHSSLLNVLEIKRSEFESLMGAAA